MTPLPVHATDAELLGFVERWATFLEVENHEAVLARTRHWPECGRTPALIRSVVNGYGAAWETQAATLHDVPTDTTQRKEISRHGFDGRVPGDTIWYDLRLDGRVSDLTATLDFEIACGGVRVPSVAKSSPLMWILLAACSLLLGGCVPGTHVDASPVAGRVASRATGRPIADAKVVLSTLGPDHETQTHTDATGRFHLAGFRHVEWTPLPYGVFRAPTGHLHVEADGYRPYGCGEFYDQNGKHPGYLNPDGQGIGGEQQVQVALVRARERQAHGCKRKLTWSVTGTPRGPTPGSRRSRERSALRPSPWGAGISKAAPST